MSEKSTIVGIAGIVDIVKIVGIVGTNYTRSLDLVGYLSTGIIG